MNFSNTISIEDISRTNKISHRYNFLQLSMSLSKDSKDSKEGNTEFDLS